jgi:hypothetical protein
MLVGKVRAEQLEVRKLLPQVDRRSHHHVKLVHHHGGRIGGESLVAVLDKSG